MTAVDAVDLPDLATLRDRWRTLAIAYHACGLPEIWASDVTLATHADPAGSGLELLVLRSQAAVLTGFDAELRDDVAWADPARLTDGAPSWVVSAVAEVAPLGDAAWWDGTGWYRSAAAAGIVRSIEVLARRLLDESGMIDELLILVEDPTTGERIPITDVERELARRIVTERPTAENLIALFDGRRYGFTADRAHAAMAAHS